MNDVLSPNTLLGDYKLLQKIALGGMAEIWAAQKDGATVALKVMYPSFAQELEFQTMFRDEVNIARRLDHPNILRVFGHGQEGDHTFQVMELVQGVDVRRMLSITARAGGWFPVPLAMYIAERVADALAFAHEQVGQDKEPLNLVHRDVSPHNVLLSRDGEVKLLDFGIAKATERITRTRTGVIKGKVSYMAPEQAMGTEVSCRTDIFALGIVLFEMLGMRRLFKADSDPETLQLVVEARVPSLRHHNPVVPEPVEAFIQRMLARAPEDRPESMREVEATLGELMRSVYPEDTYGPGPVQRLVRPHAPSLETPRRKTQVMPPEPPEEATEATQAVDSQQDATLSGMLTPEG